MIVFSLGLGFFRNDLIEKKSKKTLKDLLSASLIQFYRLNFLLSLKLIRLLLQRSLVKDDPDRDTLGSKIPLTEDP